ncbi:MAG: ROK family protein, partial [Rhodospirillaceae bacterium]|nr:ROK family protein [Rhodospirillaceae bacterium]
CMTTAVVMHNDAVVQGLSEAPFMGDVKRWGVLTIGTGLGNARFTNTR